jgi:adenylyl-sulfate kinase
LRRGGTLAFHLDGDTLRSGLCSDLGFSADDRLENIRRTAEVARLLANQGFVVVCSLISPLITQREAARQILQEAFLEVWVKCDLEECIRRDPKGLYVRAIEGQIPNFTGISAPYEPPTEPNLILDTQSLATDACVKLLIKTIHGQVP